MFTCRAQDAIEKQSSSTAGPSDGGKIASSSSSGVLLLSNEERLTSHSPRWALPMSSLLCLSETISQTIIAIGIL